MVLNTFHGYRNVLKKYPIDIVHSYRFFPNFINVLANIFSKRKVVLHVTGLGIIYANNSFKFKIYRLISNLAYYFMISFSNAVIVQNPDDLDDLSFPGINLKKLHLVKGSGVDTQLFHPGIASRQKIRSAFNIAESEKVFMCVTRLIWEKGIKEMVDAFATLHVKYPDCKLVIVGSPDHGNPMHVSPEYMHSENNRNNVFFWGAQTDIPAVLSAADVFIFPSYYREGIPRCLLEALAMGLPVITTDMPGCNLTVENGKNGLLIEPRSVEAIIRAVTFFMEGKADLPIMQSQSRKMAETFFSEDIIYHEVLAVYGS